jgi:hypothetical protein
MSTATALAVDTAPTTEATCEGMHPGDVCNNPADFEVETHTHEPFPVCRPCWDADDGRGICGLSFELETRDEHARIVGRLR